MLVEREKELARVAEALDSARLVTLIGPGGVGKTTLAQLAASEALFADLTPLDPDDLAEGISGSLGFASFADLTTELLANPHVLLLDNCEHVLDTAAGVAARLLDRCADLRILATSRERLDLPEETVLPVSPLSTEGSPSPAARMFLEATRVRGATVTDDPGTIEELCRRLDGLPLALELAAARASAMTAAEILENLDSRLDLLSRRRSRGPERHASLAATIGWSFHQLAPEERELFSRLAVLRSPFTIGMAAAVSGLDQSSTRDLLNTLVERSLVVHQPIAGASTYRMLETIRSFAAEQLDDRNSVEGRLLDYLTERADEIFAAGIMTEVAPPIELEQSFRNTYWAVDTALERDDLPRVLRLVAPWWWLEDLGHQSEAAELLERIVTRWPDVSPELAVVWGLLATLTWETDRDRSLAAVAASSTGLGAAYGERILGLTIRNAGDWLDSLSHFGKANEIASSLGHNGLALEVRIHAALAQARAGEIDVAIAELEDVIAGAGDHPLIEAWATDFLAFVLLPYNPGRSGELAQSLLPLTGNNNWLKASASYTLAIVALIADDISRSAAHFADALTAFVAIRSTADILLVYMYASPLLARSGDLEAARRVLGGDRAKHIDRLGPAERDLLGRLGPVPDVPAGTPAMPNDELIAALRRISTAGSQEAAPTSGNMFTKSGDVWLVRYNNDEIQMSDSKGLADLAMLLSRPGTEVSALDLMGARVVSGDWGATSDATARRQYESRIRELQSEIEDAESMGDVHRGERARSELDTLLDHLAAAYGLGGKERSTGEPAEKARSAVTWRIRSSIKKLTAVHPALGEHLDRSIRTGRFCVYEPTEPTNWAT